MPYETGGRADKSGNRFETRWAIYQMLKVLDEKLDYVVLEALGDDEEGIDIWAGQKNDIREGQQCKGRNGSKESWDFGSVNAKGIFRKWKYQLDRDESITVSLVSPLTFTLLEGLTNRAKNTNEKPEDFLKYQIHKYSQEFKDFFESFCKVMDINYEKEMDLIRCISYLRRISYRQFPDTELKQIILSEISRLLTGNEEEIYETFFTWIVDGDIWGRTINQFILYDFLKDKNIRYKNLANDERIQPRLEELNSKYYNAFTSLKNGMITRKEFSKCREIIESGESLIIHGKAGRGKSGCTVDLVDYCRDENIPYLSINLDNHIPLENANKWGESLGLPASIAHCIHSVSKNERAVIILDQLDALRWTQGHSRNALLVCDDVINQVERLNCERAFKISIVFVCRTYDLENDNIINSLFKNRDKDEGAIQWNKVQVNELDKEVTKEIVGEYYEQLTSKLKAILRIPSNLYIWEHLDPKKEYTECSTTSHLISEWWAQLSQKYFKLGLNETDLNHAKEVMVAFLENRTEGWLPLNILDVNRSSLGFLASNSFLSINENKVFFAHQSISDCFLAEKMLREYCNGKDILEIIGDKEKQTPGKRYQIQMFMQELLEYDSSCFIDAGTKMFESAQIRYFVKFVFLEILSQIDVLDENIKAFIINSCGNENYGDHVINNVIYSRPKYIRLLRRHGILDKWFNDPQKKDTVFKLLISMSPNYEAEDIAFIEKYAFNSEEDDNMFSRCFFHGIDQDTEELFGLRMRFYNKYPQMADMFIDFKAMLKNCEIRTIRLLAFWMENKIKRNKKNIYRYEEELLDNAPEILIENGIDVIKLLLPYIPVEKDESIGYSDWSGRYYKRGLERACIEIIKKANVAIIKQDPEIFLNIYSGFMGKGNDLYNEIILDGLYQLPETYSDLVINYLYSDFDSNIFDITSGNNDRLFLVKQVLGKHSKLCSEVEFDIFERNIISYVSPKAKEICQQRINHNREKNNYRAYWSFWGDLQKEILDILPDDRLSNRAKDLICVLDRKFPQGTTLYKSYSGHAGGVSSPIAGKNLNDKSWLGILTNKKLPNVNRTRLKEVSGGFIESSVEEFAGSFSDAVSKEPERMIKLVLSNDEEILDLYIDSLFKGVAYSNELDNVPVELFEKMIAKYPYDYVSLRANHICSLIEKRNAKWSKNVLDILKDIAINHTNPEIGKPNITSNKDKEMRSFDMLRSNAINCVRGRAAQAIARLLQDDGSLFEQFKETIEKLVRDENPAVRFSALYALWPSYNIERGWAEIRILNLYEQDFRLAGFPYSKDMLFFLYPKYRENVLEIVGKCYNSEDERLIEMGAYCLAEMYILKNEFVDVINNLDAMSEIQAKAVFNMAIVYFKYDEFNKIAKNLILRFKISSLDFKLPISRLFLDNLIDLKRDKEFLIKIMDYDLSSITVNAFVRYLEQESRSVIDYNDIITTMSYRLIENGGAEEGVWGIEDAISKLVIGLYDETANSSLPEMKDIANTCLDIWDLMFEKQIGSMRQLSKKLMDR